MRAANELNMVTAEERREDRRPAGLSQHALDDAAIEARFRAQLKEKRTHGLQRLIGLICLATDMLYPSVTRTIFQIFRCRELGISGWWLEADCTLSF